MRCCAPRHWMQAFLKIASKTLVMSRSQLVSTMFQALTGGQGVLFMQMLGTIGLGLFAGITTES